MVLYLAIGDEVDGDHGGRHLWCHGLGLGSASGLGLGLGLGSGQG